MLLKFILIIIIIISITFDSIQYVNCDECKTTDDVVKVQTPESSLKSKLLCNYDTNFPPLKNQSESIKVKIDLNMQDYRISRGFPEKLNINLKFIVTWQDINLKWNPSDYNAVSKIVLSANEIWVPEIMPEELDLFSTESASILENSKCLIAPNGTVRCEVENSHFGYCYTDILNWPYEIYECMVQYKLWTHSYQKVSVILPNGYDIIVASERRNKSKWNILSSDIEMYNTAFKRNSHITLTDISLIFKVQQDIYPFIQMYHIKLFCIVSLTLCSFWTNFDELNRLVLILVNVLCHFYTIQSIVWNVPTLGREIPCIVSAYRDSLILVLVQLITSVVLKTLMKRDKPMPFYVTLVNTLLNRNIVMKVLFIDVDNNNDDDCNNIQNGNELKLIQARELHVKRVKLQLVDRLVFLIIFSVYFILAMIIGTL